MMKKLVVLTGAGMSAESGIKTFRDSGGLWEEHRVEDVASPMGWVLNRKPVSYTHLDVYKRQDLSSTGEDRRYIGNL